MSKYEKLEGIMNYIKSTKIKYLEKLIKINLDGKLLPFQQVLKIKEDGVYFIQNEPYKVSTLNSLKDAIEVTVIIHPEVTLEKLLDMNLYVLFKTSDGRSIKTTIDDITIENDTIIMSTSIV